MRVAYIGVIAFVLAGCGDPSQLLDTPQRQVGSPAGIAPVDDLAGGGARPVNPPVAPAANGNAQPQPVAEDGGNHGQGKKSIIGRTTKEVLDVKEATKDPNIVVIDPKVSGNDPFTQAGTAYTRAAAVAGTAGVKQWIQHHKVLNDRFPTYGELQDWMKKNPGVDFPVLPAGRVYGYDDRIGEFVVLEDKGQQ